MQYVVYITLPDGQAKHLKIKATDCKQAEQIAKDKYPSSEVGRISAVTQELNYFKAIKKWKK
ncbi:MAG TPA: hypothetical protein DCS66_02865 [Flavobacteriaceae bacterium]|nr:hypothetical protein [Flavobacteriaceae bacterium]|tara:strand:- start:202 stop:387 length:186 start_codon:yes stop_codon:yes gene_type:complete